MKKWIVSITVFTVCFALAAWGLYMLLKPSISLREYGRPVYELGSAVDTLMLADRQCGYVNLDKFMALARKSDPNVSIQTAKRDSVTISTQVPSQFFRIDGDRWWKEKYKNVPVSFPDNKSFRAKVEKWDGVEYIYIPYQILTNLAAYNERNQ